MIGKLLALSLAVLSLSSHRPEGPDGPMIAPSLNLSAIRLLLCSNEEGNYIGSGEMIAPHILATARHISHGRCVDGETRTPVTAYKEDVKHDFGLMRAAGVPDDMPYVKYRCDGLHGKTYMSYGITDYNQSRPILRMNIIRLTDRINRIDDDVEGLDHAAGMKEFDGAVAPGMSGGPVIDSQGYMVAVNNAGGENDTWLFDLKDTMLCQ